MEESGHMRLGGWRVEGAEVRRGGVLSLAGTRSAEEIDWLSFDDELLGDGGLPNAHREGRVLATSTANY